MADSKTVTSHSGDHEHHDVPAGPILKFGLTLVILMVASFALVAWLFEWLSSRPVVLQHSPMVHPGELPPPPRLQVTPLRDLEALRKSEEGVINSYGWVDRDAGRVRIPVDRAMQLMVQRGFPVRGAETKPQLPRKAEVKK
jgi:hypothetical protein